MWTNPIVRGALSGFIAAASVDIHSFLNSPTWRVDGFNWNLATKRWFTGLITGAITGAGFDLAG
jgi:hypothetical protein